MSRIGKNPIQIPEKVDINITDSDIEVKWPKWEMSYSYPSGDVEIKEDGNEIKVLLKDKSKNNIWGLVRALINNMIEGVTKGYTKKLKVIWVGYGAEIKGSNLVLKLGLSHKVEYTIPENIDMSIEDEGWDDIIVISGFDKQQVGQVAAEIRWFRPPEPYKWKGIRYIDEVVKIKPGKTESAGE